MALDNPSYFALASGIDIKRSPIHENSFEFSDLSVKSHKSLCRSLSSNSENSNEFVMTGDQRLVDIYPETINGCNANEADWNHSRSVQEDNGTEYTLQNARCCYEDMFNVDNFRYYNISNENVANRRHSTGTLLTVEAVSNPLIVPKEIKEFPQTPTTACTGRNHEVFRHSSSGSVLDDHSIRHGSYPRKRCNLCNKRTIAKTENMDDILIISVKQSQAAALWVEYFISYFQQISKQANRKPFKVLHIGAEDFIDSNCDFHAIGDRVSNVKLQLVVVCPSLLDHIIKYPTSSMTLGKLLIPDRTLALLLGVSDEDLVDIHKVALPTYFQWLRYRVGQDQDENFTKEFLASAMTIFSKVWKQQSSVLPIVKSHFSVLPKKIKQGQSSIVIILTHPLQKDDVIKVSIERNNEMMEIRSVKRRNPYTLKINVPDMCTEVSSIINIVVEKNGNIIGSRPVKCESRLRELEQILRSLDNPVDFMCQALELPSMDVKMLDNYLSEAFHKNIPPHFNLCANSPMEKSPQKNTGRSEFPTLLHFAARYGFENLGKLLIECPGSDFACDVKNNSGMTPKDIAEKYGHLHVSSMLKNFNKANECNKVNENWKEVKLRLKIKDLEEDSKHSQFKETQELYKICPPPRPLLSVSSTESQTSLDGLNNRISAISFSSVEEAKTPSDADEKKINQESYDAEHLQKAVSSLDYSFLPPPKPVHLYKNIEGVEIKQNGVKINMSNGHLPCCN